MGQPFIELRAQEFSQFCNELVGKLNDSVTLNQVIDAEVASVLQKTVTNTKIANKQKIVARFSRKKWTTYGGKKYRLTWHMPDPIWAGIEKLRNANFGRRLAAVGLSAQSWYLLAKAAGFQIKVPAQVAAATAPNPHPTNVEVERSRSSGNYGIEITNSMPVLRFDPPGGLYALYAAINGRIKFFQANLAHGVFSDAEQIARKYPGIQAQISEAAIEQALVYDK